MDKFLEARREKRRRIDECLVALQMVRSSSLKDIIQAKWHEENMLPFLVTKYGHSAVEIGRYALQNFPPKRFCPNARKPGLGVLPMVVNAGVPEIEAEQFVELLSSCANFLAFNLNKALEDHSNNTGVPSVLLTPPHQLIEGGCLVCGSELGTHNNSCEVTIFAITGHVRATKVCWRCTSCRLNYNYSMYGSTDSGYKFYKEPRPLIEASNVTFVERIVCNYQIHLANHAWVSFEGFAEAFNCAVKDFCTISKQVERRLSSPLSAGMLEHANQLERRTVSSAFYWHEIEEELRKRGLSEWIFTGNKDENLDGVMKHIDGVRCSELYSHSEEDCSDDCRKRGCSNFVSMDGIWKLRFPHCMYPVKTTISGLPAINYPDVCPKEPLSRTSAFCEEHCDVAKTNNVPTNLREFLHDYCGVPRTKDGKKEEEASPLTDVEKVEDKRTQLLSQTSSSEVAEMQGTTTFLSENPELLNVSMESSHDNENEACNKDTGEKQKTLQKWSRGLLHYVRSGGHIDRWSPLFVSESTGQVFLLTIHYLYERLKDVPQDEWENFILSYDNMCNLCKLRGARANLPLPKPYDSLWLKITKVIDRLHLRNHKNELCHSLYSSEPLKAKYPDLNTMVAEQTFAWSARYKKILNAMPMRRFLFYYHRMVVHRNKYTSDCHKRKKTPLLPKVRSVK